MIVQMIGDVLGWVMYFCYRLMHNYGLTIILFTLITKIILLPISVMVQKNSIKMVKMYPQMNHIKAKYYGDKDMISEEQYHLYKQEQYHPMLDLIPVALQLIILMGVIDVIYKPLRHLLRISNEYIDPVLQVFHTLTGIAPETGSIQIQLADYISRSGNAAAFASVAPDHILGQIASLDLTFCGFNLAVIPISAGGTSIIIPLTAALSAWLMCFTQNKANVLQSEQGKINKSVTLLLSVGLSLYLGFFVPAGVGFYWIISNLMSIALMYILNYFINPKKYIDYEALEASKHELEQLHQPDSQARKDKTLISLEKRDYRRFLKYENKQIVFYSEKNGFYKYFQNVIELILNKTDIIIHYITSDPNDEVFKLQNENFQVYYIGEHKLIVLMMKMDADIVVMTMPDLQKYHIKRSMIRDDIEYIYMDHGIGSINLMLRKHALDHFDTIFASNDIAYHEIRRQEEVYGLKPKTIVKYGFGLIDNMIAAYSNQSITSDEKAPKVILIAPSWQEDNMLDLCIDEILQNLLKHNYHIILRPHPQYVRHYEGKLKLLEEKYSKYDNFTLQSDFSSNETVFNADILMTDWSGIAYEYSFTTLKPSLFINTPMKVMNPDWEEIDVTPFDIEVRDQMGISVEMDQLDSIDTVVEKLLFEENYSKENMKKMREKYLYNISESAKTGADYIINRLIEISRS